MGLLNEKRLEIEKVENTQSECVSVRRKLVWLTWFHWKEADREESGTYIIFIVTITLLKV